MRTDLSRSLKPMPQDGGQQPLCGSRYWVRAQHDVLFHTYMNLAYYEPDRSVKLSNARIILLCTFASGV